jgi:polysaccharide deacetylase 2 family uncharacterized protein YibQ
MEKKLIIILVALLLSMFGCKGNKDTNKVDADDGIIEESYAEDSTPDEKNEIKDEGKSQPTALSSYKYNWTEGDDLPPVVIIIDDFGQISGDLLNAFLDLPKEVAFAILPDLSNTENTSKLANKADHEVLIHIPMQAENSSANPGKRYIKSKMDADEIRSMIADFHQQIPHAIAANNHMGSATTAELSTMNSVLETLDKLDLFFVDSATTAKSAVPTVAQNLGQKTLKRDVFLDVPDNSETTIVDKINGLSRYKGRREPIVVITHCHNKDKLEALKKFIAQIESMGIKLIPPSKALRIATPA